MPVCTQASSKVGQSCAFITCMALAGKLAGKHLNNRMQQFHTPMCPCAYVPPHAWMLITHMAQTMNPCRFLITQKAKSNDYSCAFFWKPCSKPAKMAYMQWNLFSWQWIAKIVFGRAISEPQATIKFARFPPAGKPFHILFQGNIAHDCMFSVY